MTLYLCRICQATVAEEDMTCVEGHAMTGKNRLTVGNSPAPMSPPPPAPKVERPAWSVETVDPNQGFDSRSRPPNNEGTSPGPDDTLVRREKLRRRARKLSRPNEGAKPDSDEPKKSKTPDPVPLGDNKTARPPKGGSGPTPSLGHPLRPSPGQQTHTKATALGTPCPRCKTPTDPAKYFCEHCRQPLQQSRGVRIRRLIPRNPWHRRAMGTVRKPGVDTRTWGQRIRDRGLRDSLRHGGGLSPSSRFGLLGAAAAAIIGIGILVMAWSPLASFFNPPSESIEFGLRLSAAAVGTAELDTLDRIHDGSPESPLLLDWPEGKTTSAICAAEDAHVIEFVFSEGASPDLMRLFVSRTDPQGAETPDSWPGPRQISLRGTDRCDGPMETATDHGWIELDVRDLVGSGNRIELFIHDRWIDPNAEYYPVVAIGEVEFLG